MSQPTSEQLREYKLIRQWGRDFNLANRTKKKKPFAEDLVLQLIREDDK